MSKAIKQLKDKAGLPYYPATTTESVVDRTRRKSLDNILDDIDTALRNAGGSGVSEASQVSFTPTATISATNVQEAIGEVLQNAAAAQQAAVSAGAAAQQVVGDLDKVEADVEALKAKKVVMSESLTHIESITRTDYDTKKALGELSDTTAYLITE